MSRKLFGTILLLFGLFSLSQGTLRADTIGDMRWEGSDLLVRFSDSVSYTIDLAASDSSQLVVRFRNVTIPAGLPTSLSGRNEGSRSRNARGNAPQAIITTAPPDEVRLTVHTEEGRLGYVTLWRPYSRTFVVHTFDWNNLDYTTEQYYKGLLAMEQGLNDHAIELLSIAEATGDPRAASVLGSYYARRGDHRTAEQYLDNPRIADDFAALADVKRRNGDSAAAASNQAKADQMMAGASEPGPERENTRNSRRGEGGGRSGGSLDDDSFETNDMIRDREALKWIYVGGGILLLLLLIALITWFGRRSRRSRNDYPDSIPAPAPPPPPPAEAEWVEVRESRSEPVTRPAPTADVAQTTEVRTEQSAIPAEPRVTEAPRTVEHSASATTIASTPSTPTQAADLRRRIEEMRTRTETRPASPAPAAGHPEPNESTIAEARRLQLSRDSVELRRRLERMKKL